MMSRFRIYFLLSCMPWIVSAAVIGMNPPPQRLTADRIEALPPEQQVSWDKYLKNSTRELRTCKSLFSLEMKQHGVDKFKTPLAAKSTEGLPKDKPLEWYGQAEAHCLADIIISFQTPSGGWGKNVNLTLQPRVPGEVFSGDYESGSAGNTNDLVHPANSKLVGTFDNDATTVQMHFLAKVIAASETNKNASWRSNFFRGLDYIFTVQYPNGGWPQTWPLTGSYHDAITYNDGAMIRVLELLRTVAAGQNEFAFVPPEIRARASASLQRGLECVLATQIMVDGQRTVWGQQHDMLTLRPASARGYEMPAQTSVESAQIMLFLMGFSSPDTNLVAAVHAAAAWLKKNQIRDMAFTKDGGDGPKLIPAPGAAPIWAHFYEIGTDRPIFGDRDKSIHDTVNELPKERREGYLWYSQTPQKALERYALWAKGLAANK